MPGLKGPRAAGGSGAVTHGLPARHSLPGTPCARALPSLPEQGSGAPLTVPWHPGDGRTCGAALALPARCLVWVEQGVHILQGSVLRVQCL